MSDKEIEIKGKGESTRISIREGGVDIVSSLIWSCGQVQLNKLIGHLQKCGDGSKHALVLVEGVKKYNETNSQGRKRF